MRTFSATVLVALLFVSVALAAIKLPALTGRVVDEAGALSSTQRSALETELATHEQKTGQQVVVAIVKSLQGVEIEEYGVDLIRGWGIGQKGKNTGAILLVAPNEKRVRIEVGYGLEGSLTDAASRVIIERTILPQIKRGDLPAGVLAGAHEMLRVLTGELSAEELAPVQGAVAVPDPPAWTGYVIIVLFLLFVFWRVRTRGVVGTLLDVIWVVASSSRGGSSGGSWGGGGGGFSGGGGSGGGGGASGSW
ncbi:TPM domain-containing protein [Roseiterribacter gracilis]|uniref:TPM domain-containing protein n=1 Tax=Roseiterribacter gracilis TaxID=2812848 RepID=A0A8S8X7G3_9PROT|nr:hypothetical protein TMPK1_05710 [Rhodospirillales bacterium TMPK1]